MYIRDIISKKRNKGVLNDEEINFVIQGYFKNEISDAQMSALMTAMHIFGVNEKELLYLSVAISQTGKELEMYRTSREVTDIHSLGGVSDKIILCLISIIHSLGHPSVKIIGREFGMEDRITSIPGFKLEEDLEQFKIRILNGDIDVLKSIDNLAPIEEKLYSLRHEIACDNDISLIATSIMSQKMSLRIL